MADFDKLKLAVIGEPREVREYQPDGFPDAAPTTEQPDLDPIKEPEKIPSDVHISDNVVALWADQDV